jgi:hypothetical protein
MSAGETSAAHRLFARAAASGAQPSGDAGAPAAGAAAPPRAPTGSGGELLARCSRST